MPPKYTYEQTVSSFWAKVDRNGPIPAHRPDLGPCWIWTGTKGSRGYGNFWYLGATQMAHHVSWWLAVGPIPDGLWILHHCDNRPCVRPSHLFDGTAQDNTDDMIAKGRHEGVRLGRLPKPPRRSRRDGPLHHLATLTTAQVEEVRALAESGLSQRQIGLRYGVRQGTISNIILRKTRRDG
jgi:hypothetical protein